MKTHGKPELSENRTIPPVPRPSGLQRVYCNIHKTNVLIKFHDDWTIHVTSREKDPSPPGGHVFLPIQTICELNRCIKETNVLTKFHKDWAKNVSYRLFTCFHYIHIEKTGPPPGSHVFQMITTICELAKNVTSRVKKTPPPGRHVFFYRSKPFSNSTVVSMFTCFHYTHIKKLPRPLAAMFFSPIWTIFKLVRDINETNLLTKFHDDWANIVTSRVFKRNTSPPPGGHTNILTKLHEDWTSNATSTVFTIFELKMWPLECSQSTMLSTHARRTHDGRTTDARRTHDGRRAKGDPKSSP
ncbi:hypothetical protein DPMN_174362 [Dreissena polymorpha]|uniref:Uncharacterized protein n=1 Tax=Dreissena polymorpha TaxID=45954 RepID=A0A9D4IH20_DREPO|nr:hypothetical protein DPMN_174362 [Dreissena polymorpha]